MKKKVLLITILAAVSLLLFSPYTAFLRSYAVMFIYNGINYRGSVIKKNDISFYIPGGSFTKERDWYPFVNTFNDNEGLSWFLNKKVEFTVLYNFGHFDLKSGCSSYYDPNSPFYSSFYGGYVVKPANDEERFGFLEDGSLNISELNRVPEYDQIHLVLPSIGCPGYKSTFHTNIKTIEYGKPYAGYNDWIIAESEVSTNSPLHSKSKYRRGYLQFGAPGYQHEVKEDFSVIKLKGRAYVRFFEDYNATVILYILAPTWEAVDKCDNDILRHTVIR